MGKKQIAPVRQKWKASMTDRQRFNNQMHYKPVDRCFNMEFGYWKENFKKWPLFIENNIKSNDDADVFFNFDVIKYPQQEQIWMQPVFEEKVVEEIEGKKIIINSDGLLAEIPADGHDTIAHFIKPSIVMPEDWKKCKAERFVRDDPARKVDVEAMKAEYPPDRDYPLGVHCGSMIGLIRNMLTFEGLAYAIHDYPEMVEDMVETCCVLVEDFLDQVLWHIDYDFAWG